ncbi:herpesviridae UL52 UL70 DNA primase family [Cryptosporidium sp. chipmunk genotype I]|uniref:herpesviridae UL52 UL70 DNA primase family n=1 Tax=Cryptosporidium sp. chipmunk genotype I TaxID=1280935 RepID=UPI00351AAD4D|nr:herpesviridae UL52 UL70 DNA primase family [Cryptosporidium sp. chipmunk genotype I]
MTYFFKNLDNLVSDHPQLYSNLKQQYKSILENKDHIYYELLKNKYINPYLDKIDYSKIFKRFFSQEKAIEYYCSIISHFGQIEDSDDSRILPIGVFAEETSANGSRNYIVSSYESIWYYISSLCKYGIHLYEVILVNQPCWLYFDIEYNKNQYNLDDNQILIDFTNNLKLWINFAFGYLIDKSDIIYLSSSNFDKFSYHIIVKKIDKVQNFSTLFKDNISMKIFVTHFISFLNKKNVLLVGFDHFKLENIIDTGVYTRNRCFRMLYSSKFGKKSILEIDETNTSFALTNISPIKLFRSMITFLNTHSFSKSTFISRINVINQLCFDLEKSFLTKICNISEISLNKCKNIENTKFIPKHLVKVTEYVILFWNKLCEELQNNPKLTFSYLEESKLIDYCLNKINFDFVDQISIRIQMFISTAMYFKEKELIVISVSKLNRLCFNVEREHISNGIKLIINFKKKRFYQKCFDPDCINFKSRSFTIPASIINYSSDILELSEMVNF